MIQIVQVPVAWSMTKEAQHFAEELGNMPRIQEMRDKEHEQAKAQLDTCLEGGFTLLSTVVVEVTSRTLLMYTLHKPDKSA